MVHLPLTFRRMGRSRAWSLFQGAKGLRTWRRSDEGDIATEICWASDDEGGGW